MERLVACVLVSLLVAAPAHARPVAAKVSAQALAQAKAAFKAATLDYDAGRFEQARTGFERSHELSRNPILYFNLAACDEKLGQTRVAIAHLRAYLAEVPNADDAAQVRERVGGLDERARQEDEHRADEQRRAEDEAARIKVLEEQRRVERERPVVVVAPPEPPKPIPVGKRYRGAFIALGVAGGLALVGGGLGIAAIERYDSLKSDCGSSCTDDRVAPVRHLALAADILYGAAGVAAVATIVLLVVESRGPKVQRDRVALSSAGVGVRF